MGTSTAPPQPQVAPRPAVRRAPARRRDRTPLALAGVLLAAFALRVWGIGHGLPFSYNVDEERHFVPIAVGFFGHGLDPGYFLNPPGYTELLSAVYAVWFGGRDAVAHAYAANPSEVFLLARLTVAALGTASVWLLYAVGSRLFDRSVALLAAALSAVAFLPVFYSHLALNDVPAMAPATLALLGTAMVLRGGGAGALALGGAGAGLAAGTKYTAGIVLLPLLTAVLQQARTSSRSGWRGAGIALGAAGAGFLLANPYALLDFHAFRDGVAQQQDLAGGGDLEKLGLTQDSGVLYYLWTLTWGIGWIPAVAAGAGAVLLALRDGRLTLVLLPTPLLFVLFMGAQERYFGRWLLPVFPIAILLAAFAGVSAIRVVARRSSGLRAPAAVLVVVALIGQGLVTTLHTDRVLARPDTRGTLREWMLAHVPAGARVVIEPIVPAAWGADPNRAAPATPGGARWRMWDVSRSDVDDFGRPLPRGRTRFVKVDKYERTLRPALLGAYVRAGYCWVAIGSTQFQRARAQPRQAPRAIAYYRALARRGREVLRLSPYRTGASAPAFNFDWSFDAYPAAYARPGPEIVVYRLRGGRCG